MLYIITTNFQDIMEAVTADKYYWLSVLRVNDYLRVRPPNQAVVNLTAIYPLAR